ncbi:MAG: hypothetical protein ACREQP_02935, partial [Candidatus Binatia bacterium]
MNPFFIIAIPVVLLMTGMILNGIQISFDQPETSTEPDAGKKLAAERQSYRNLFDSQRRNSLTRQKRVGQYSWVVLLAIVGSSVWLYVDTVNKTTVSKEIAAIQTLSVVEGKEMVLSLTLSDGNNIQYLVKSPAMTLTVADSTNTQFMKPGKTQSWDASAQA